MTREDKIQKRKERKHARSLRRKEKYACDYRKVKEIMEEGGMTFSQARSYSKYRYFIDWQGRERQLCEMGGTCNSPCNGDC